MNENDEDSLIHCFNVQTDDEDGVLPKNVVPFAIDPAGNNICFDYKDNSAEPKVVYLDLDEQVSLLIVDNDYGIDINDYQSEAEAIEFLQRRSLQYVADSFEDFMNMLYSS
nr:SMI1/KNR4 family protein [Clostridium sp. DSM 8431]